MGLLVKGKWQNDWYDTKKTAGEFVRPDTSFREFINSDPKSKYPAIANRYHLYVSYACPWAHRTLIVRKLKDLETLISVTNVMPVIKDHGWEFGKTPDPINGFQYLHQVYTKANPKYSGRVTVPVLWDKKTHTIINNESADIIRMFNSEFDALTENDLDLYPDELQSQIEDINEFVYDNINNGVYKCGFATKQSAYESAFDNLFAALDEVEKQLTGNQYLIGNHLTEADWRLFTTLIRFDSVYHHLFKCNRNYLGSFPNIQRYLLQLYTIPGIADTVNMGQIKQHYYQSLTQINPTKIVPKGPILTHFAAHNPDS